MKSLTQLTPAQLRQAADIQEQIGQLQNQLNEVLGGEVPAPASIDAPKIRGRRKRRKMTAAWRKALERAWAARRAKTKAAGKAKG